MLYHSLLLTSWMISILAVHPDLRNEIEASSSTIRQSSTEDILHALEINTNEIPSRSTKYKRKNTINDMAEIQRGAKRSRRLNLNSDRVKLLLKHSKDISGLHKQLEKYLNNIEDNLPDHKSKQVSEARIILQKCKNGIQYLIQRKRENLANSKAFFPTTELNAWIVSDGLSIDPKYAREPGIPMELSSIIFDKYLPSVGHEVLKDAMKLITDYRDVFIDSPMMEHESAVRLDFSIVSQYAGKVGEFLFEEEMIDPLVVTEMFEDDRIVKEIIFLNANYLIHHKLLPMDSFSDFPVQFTKHWYYLVFNKYRSALGRKEEVVIDVVYYFELIKKIVKTSVETIRLENYLNVSKSQIDSTNWEEVARLFSTESYFSKLKDLIAANHSTFSSNKDISDTTLLIDPSEFKEGIINMITKFVESCPQDFLASQNANPKLIPAIFCLLKYIEDNLFQGIIKEVLEKINLFNLIPGLEPLMRNTHQYDYKNIVELVSVSSSLLRMHFLSCMYQLFHVQQHHPWCHFSCDKNIVNAYSKLSTSLFDEQQIVKDRLVENREEICHILKNNYQILLSS